MSMSVIVCPSCGEKGNLPDHLMGKKIRCQKCGKSCVAGAIPPASASPAGETIDVDGLDASIWEASSSAATVAAEPDEPGSGPSSHFAASATAVGPPGGPARQYKVLTQKDRWFEGKFELSRLEDALNHYARQGWTVRSMATPLVTGFSGGPREEIVVLLER